MRRSSPPPPTAATCSRAARRWLRRSWPASPRSPPRRTRHQRFRPRAPLLTQNATRANLRVASGYVDALNSVLEAAGTRGQDATTPPSLRILEATRKGRRTRIQAAAPGSTAAIRRYRAGSARCRRPPRRPAQHVPGHRRRRGGRVRIDALDVNGQNGGQRVAQGHAAAEGQGNVGKGGGVRTWARGRAARRRGYHRRVCLQRLGGAADDHMKGAPITRSLVADLAYFYRHAPQSAAFHARRRRDRRGHRRHRSPSPTPG